MATVSVTRHIKDDTNNTDHGSVSDAVTLTTSGSSYSTTTTVADNFGNAVLWATGDGGITTFDYLYIESDADVFIELRNDNATDEFCLIKITAGHSLLLPGGLLGGYQTTTRIDGAVLVAGTDYGSIDQIKAHNDAAEAAGDAVIKLVLFD